MSITAALGNAFSGLTVAARGIQIVSQNVANAQTEGYSKRDLAVSHHVVGDSVGGVRIDGVERRHDPALVIERRGAQASLADAQVKNQAHATLEELFGDPSAPGSLNQRIAKFSSDLITAASRPDASARLASAVQSAGALAEKINEMSSEIQQLRQNADQAIARDVSTLNASLQNVAEIDGRIARLGQGSRDISSLLDDRQRAIDGIAGILPIREVPRDGGKIALFTTGGAILYESQPSNIAFSTHPSVSPVLSLNNGDLSSVEINGINHSILENASKIKGGSLYANMLVRDQVAVEAQENLDAFARDLIARYQDTSLDITLSAGDVGLFSDNGSAFNPSNEVGISGRIQLSATVDPDQGGSSWRLRDGLGAATPGDTGDASLLNALHERLSDARTVVSGSASGALLSISEQSAEMLSHVATKRQESERNVAYEISQFDALKEAELRNGVDTDEEMRNLLALEQAYAANARVMSTVDELLDTLIRI